MSNIKLGSIKLPANDFVERATGLIAKRGKGKSGLVKVIEEELAALGLPFVVFDPTGIHWGIKSSFNGTRPSGIEVLVIGGSHGDLPLDRHAGRIVAKAIAGTDTSLIVDFKGSSHAVYRQFVADFADELLDTNKIPRLIILEEAPRLIPQKLRPDQTASFDAVARLVLEGRNSGLGCILVSQRAATVNKDVLTQVDNMIVMGLTGPQDRKAIKEWVEENADPELLDKFLSGLSGLQPREGWLWSPDMDIFKSFRTQDFTTFHPDRTHLRRMDLLESTAVTTDTKELVRQLGDEIQQFAQKVKENDPAELKRQISKLEKQLKQQVPVVQEPQVIEVPVLNQLDMEKLAYMVEEWERMRENFQMAADWQKDFFERLAQFQKNGKRPERVPVVRVERAYGKQPVKSYYKKQKEVPVTEAVIDVDIDGPMQRILNALGWFRSIGITTPLKTSVAFLANYSPRGGAFSNPLGRLSKMGWIQYVSGNAVSLTVIGEKFAEIPEELLTTEEMIGHIMAVLPGPEAAILKTIIGFWPNAVPKEQVAKQTLSSRGTPYSPEGGAFANPLGRLKTLGLITYPQSGWVRASDFIFIDED